MTTGEYLDELKKLTLEYEKEHETIVVSVTMEREIFENGYSKHICYPKFLVRMANERDL